MSEETPIKRGRGRPPKHGLNRFTGLRAQRIEYVRQYLRKVLEEESFNPAQKMSACRLLLSLEELMPNRKGLETRKKMLDLGEQGMAGTIGEHSLLAKLGLTDEDDDAV